MARTQLTEEQLRSLDKICSASPDAVFVMDADGRYLYINRNAATILGLEQDQVIGKTMREVGIPPDIRERFEAELKNVLTTGSPLSSEATVDIRLEGRSFEYTIRPIVDEGGSFQSALVTVRDVTERKEIERCLREAEERFRLLAENAQDLIYRYRLLPAPGFEYISPSATAITGYTPEEHYANPNLGFELVYPDDRPILEEMVRNPSRETITLRWVRKDGAVIWTEQRNTPIYDEEGRLIAIEGIARDITDRKKVEEALRMSEERFRRIFEEGPLGMAITSLDFRLVGVNARLSQMLGRTREELTSRTFPDITHPDDIEKDVSLAHKLFSGEVPFYQIEKRYVRKDGRVFWASLTASAIRDEEGNPLYGLAMIEDITDRKIARELSYALNDINSAIISTLDINEILQRAVVKSAHAMGAEVAAISLREDGRWVAKYLYGFAEQAAGKELTSEEVEYAESVLRAGEPVAISDALNDPRVDAALMRKYGVRSVLAIPLAARGEAIGVMRFVYLSAPAAFTDAHIDFARKLGALVSLVVQNARLYRAEQSIADILQESLLVLPERIEGIDFGYLYRSASDVARVGGDFYDVFELEHGKVGIMVGDVAGKGIGATALTSIVKNTIRAHAFEGATPAMTVSKTNDLVAKMSSPSEFVTIFFAILDAREERLLYCSAGHPPAVIRRKTGLVDLLEKHSPIIGAFTGLHYRSGRVKFQEGDMLIIYTDGLIEARHDTEFYGQDRLVEFVAGLESKPARDVPRAIFDDVVRFTGGRLADDLALMTVSLE